MADNRFDELTKTLSTSASRRMVIKGVLAAALGGALAQVRGGGQAEATRARRACSRLGQDCGGTAPACCAGMACEDGACCKPENENCLEDSDCCGDNVCRPNPDGLGARCLPPGDLGTTCSEVSDCVGGLACEGGVCCLTEQSDCADASDCCGDLVCAPDLALGVAGETYCIQCREDMAACADDRQCCGGVCDPYTGTCFSGSTCGGPGDSCAGNGDCCAPFSCLNSTCQFNFVFCSAVGQPCFPFGCCSGLICDTLQAPPFGLCVAAS